MKYLFINSLNIFVSVGEHEIDVIVNGQHCGIGPLVMDVLEPPKIARIPSTILAGKEIVFECKLS